MPISITDSATLPSYYRSMLSSVVHRLKAIPVPKKSKPPTDEQLEDRLHYLAISTKVLFLLINLVKVGLQYGGGKPLYDSESLLCLSLAVV